MKRLPVIVIILLATSPFLLRLFSTSASVSQTSPALAAYASATLTAGIGLGDLKLGETTLGSIVDKFGPGQVAVGYGDDIWIELGFMLGEVRFMFAVTGQCYQDTGRGMKRLEVKPNITTLLKQHPSCKHLPLTEIYLTARNTDPTKTFYKGRTDQGLRLWQRFSDIEPSPATGILVDLTSAKKKLGYLDTIEQLESITVHPGVNLYYQGPTAYEIQSGQALSQERLKELERNRNFSLEDMVVRQFRIYRPVN